MNSRRPLVWLLAIAATSLSAGLAVPAVWRASDIQLQVTPHGGIDGSWRTDLLDPWRRPFASLQCDDRNLHGYLDDLWDRRPYVGPEIVPARDKGDFCPPSYERIYSLGPDGVNNKKGSSADTGCQNADDILLLHPADPKLRLFNASGALAAMAVLGLGHLVGLVVGWRALTGRRGQIGASAIGALGAVLIAAPVQEVWSIVSSSAPFTLWQVVPSAALGGAVLGLALARSRHEVSSSRDFSVALGP